ncbi:MAG: hypothetical protein HY017_06575 [Betaproteobacteria bacterium]|nr:hypothetical protein [Betaproteobacteria bacterium]
MSEGKSSQQNADLLREIDSLKALADTGMCEDAPEACALAREKLLQLYRNHHAAVGRFTFDGSGEGDFEALDWICRLEATGHIGATRLLNRVFFTSYSSMGIDASFCQKAFAATREMQMLGRKFAKVAQFLAVMEMAMPERNLDALLVWLDLGGAVHSSLAFGIRELRASSLAIGPNALGTISHHVHWAKETAKARSASPVRVPAADLLSAVASDFARVADTAPPHRRPTVGEAAEAARLIARAAELGSEEARVKLWFDRYRSVPDKDVHLRDWLSTHLLPESGDGAFAETQASPVSVAREFVREGDMDRAMFVARELLRSGNGALQTRARGLLDLIRRMA